MFELNQCRGVLAISAFLLPASTLSAADFEFVDVSAKNGIGVYTQTPGMAGGVAAADYDADGDIDLFVPTASTMGDQLYQNLGDGTFQEIAADVGLDSLHPHRAALWFDCDDDGDLDLVVAGCDEFVPCGPAPALLHLYEQHADGTFSDITSGTGLVFDASAGSTHVAGISAGDLNNDGRLDLVLCLWSGHLAVFRNEGDGLFTDIGTSSGISGFTQAWQPMMHDFNADGWLDIYIAIDFHPNRLYLNQQDGTFVDVAAAAGADNSMNDMGLTLGDYDNDGDFDIYLTNIFEYTHEAEHNVLYRNDSVGPDLAFTDVSVPSGTDWGGWGWGATFFDADHDGWLDLAATNGFEHECCLDDPSRFYRNRGDGTFADVSAEVGFDDTHWGSGLVAFDHDRDGDLDLVQACTFGGPLRLLENVAAGPTPTGHWLLVQPRQADRNRQAIGAVVRVQAGDLSLIRLISAGTSLLSQEPAEAHFGLSDAPVVDTLSIDWPDGSTTTWSNVPADRRVTLFPDGICGDINLDTTVGISDLLVLLASWGPCPDPPADCPADLDGGGSVDFVDLLILLGHWGTQQPCLP